MSVRVWKRIALTAALLVWGAASQAQTAGATAGGSMGGQGAVPQVRPAPVTGRVAADPAAVALRPAGQAPLTSTARQVPPPVNPNEPLLTPESEQVRAVSGARHAQRAPVAGLEAAPPVTTPTRQHVDRTRGVKKEGETQPRPHERKTKGRPHHAGQKASSVEPKDERHKGGNGVKRGGASSSHGQHVGQPAGHHVAPDAVAARHRLKKPAAPGKLGASSTEGSEARVARHDKKRLMARGTQAGTHNGALQAHPARTSAHVKQANSASLTKKTHHAHAAAARASAPVAKKPVRHKQPSA